MASSKLVLFRPAASLAGRSAFRSFSSAAAAGGDDVADAFRRFLLFGSPNFTLGPQSPYSSTGSNVDHESPFPKPPFDSSPKYEAYAGPQGPYSSTGFHVDYEGLFPKPPFDSSPKYEAYEDHLCLGWDYNLTKESLNLRFAMAGFDKNDVNVTVNNNTLIIKGKGEGICSNPEEREGEYGAQVVLPEGVLKLDQVKAVMKNGMLSIMLPKLKEEERADVFPVEVE